MNKSLHKFNCTSQRYDDEFIKQLSSNQALKMTLKCKYLILMILIIDILCHCIAQKGTCTKVNSCKCAYKDGAIVDLSSLGNSDGSAR